MTGERIPVVDVEVGLLPNLNDNNIEGDWGGGVDGGTRKSSLDSCDGAGISGQPSSKVLLIKMANDYSQYLKTDLSLQVMQKFSFVDCEFHLCLRFSSDYKS